MTQSDIIEDFEDTDMQFKPFLNNGWERTDTLSKDGSYSYKSPVINDSELAFFEVKISTKQEDTDSYLTFDYKVDSEEDYDIFKVYVDNNEILRDSGQKDWLNFSYPLTPGEHSIKFEYSKDGGTSSGMDAVYIDNLNIKCGGELPVGMSGIKELQYSLDDGATWIKYENPVSLEAGPNNIKAKVIDNAGNESEISEEVIQYEVLEMIFNSNKINFDTIGGNSIEKSLGFTITSSSNYDIYASSPEDIISESNSIPIDKIETAVDLNGYVPLDKKNKTNLASDILWGRNNEHTLKFKVNPLTGYPEGNYKTNITIEAVQR